MVDGINSDPSIQGMNLGEGNLEPFDIQTLLLTLQMERSETLNGSLMDQANQMKASNEKLKQANQVMANLRVAQANAQAPDDVTWNVDKNSNVITLDGYQIELNESRSQWTLSKLDDNGEKIPGSETRIWGDPHVDEDNDGRTDWDFKKDTTFVLEDGTKISVGTKQWGNSDYTTSDTLTITKGDQAIQVTGLTQNDDTPLSISDVGLNGRQLDMDTTDGHYVYANASVNQWTDGSGTDLGDDQGNWKMHFESEATNAAETYQQKQVDVDPETVQWLKDNGVTIVDSDGDGQLSADDLASTIENLKGTIDTLNATSQMDMIRLQSLNNKYTQSFDMMTNFIKKFDANKDGIIRNMG
ncbi:DUF1521 domain-containing protein [Acanthopleuribacter pedis]|uniref:DUF1521 domain-containing protein n=1 Tax=Acanthopleuribacter pedis TaxID=442870 RepID=A0A8J7QEP0_9BACT|nr:DUF1521 domain-containing protein [Acanthopleuribacter pedis]MBO1322579.1 DUF1521 domain-containing protein [Acanthopleuribacter pedis]